MIAELEGDVMTAKRASSELQQTEAAFASLRATMVEAIIATLPDEQGRAKIDRLVCSCQVLDAVKNMLMQTASQGHVAEHTLELIRSGVIEAN